MLDCRRRGKTVRDWYEDAAPETSEPPAYQGFRDIGAPGFEPGTSSTQSLRANQAALRPVCGGRV